MRLDPKTKSSLMSIITFVIAIFGISHSAHGQLDCSNPAHVGLSVEPVAFNYPAIPYDMPNGGVIAVTTTGWTYRCSYGSRVEFLSSLRKTEFPGVGTFPNYPYLGFKIYNAGTGEVLNPATTQTWDLSGVTPGTIKMKVELIKLNNTIYDGKFWPRDRIIALGAMLFKDPWDPSRINTFNVSVSGTGQKIETMQQSCNVTTSLVNVRLPPVNAGQLNSIGATAGDMGFNIGLKCYSSAFLYVTLTDLTAPGNTSNQLTLAPASTAKGVKLRILRNGSPVGYGPDSRVAGNPNQWYVGRASTTTNIPLSAQYIATGPVSAGTVKGVATFTMSYQ
ncbi:fimbrial protein [Burkholderia ubonensis]|uniref:fimbrial protein n=1 Tax=Burkholderia ubonensis TaxID=101571 RepID=UPI0009B44529|nr:fimbrial protein [Burkholderia ubonensis]